MTSSSRLGGRSDALPEVNDLVRVSVAGSGVQADGALADAVRSRVENVLLNDATGGSRRYSVAAPRYRGDAELPSVGTPCTLEWPGEQGLWILPVAFVGEELAREGLRVWVLDTIGPPRQRERRAYVRVPWSVPIMLTPRSAAEVRQAVAGGLQGRTMAAEPADQETLHEISGQTSDISEGGIRALLAAPPPPDDLGVIVHLEVSGEHFELPSRICWAKPSGRPDTLQFEAALAFDNPDRHGDRLRPLLFAEQLRIRRAGLA